MLVIIVTAVGLNFAFLEDTQTSVQCGDGGLDTECKHCTSSSSDRCNSDDCVWNSDAEFSDSGPCVPREGDLVQCGTEAGRDSACEHCDAHSANDNRCNSDDCFWNPDGFSGCSPVGEGGGGGVECGDGGRDSECKHCTSSSPDKCNSDDCVWNSDTEFSDSGPCIPRGGDRE